ncbi:amidohydrolase family protein [Clostridium oryzae]|uniref:N-substituted formamide deformylase n=1 Tax=Clostridium oryzae TaxID=1450648 RepID=A0A1V4IDJ6_9CLOT|nr:amidohydrolase family protein [Clostridium oryzae]OPJ58023.1 N-substituted formamide deformylase precursor [Clostridium oryzae]
MIKANIILKSSSIFTAVNYKKISGYVVISGSDIVGVFEGDVKQELIGSETRLYDLGDRTICPGFCDTHTFFPGYVIEHLGRNYESVCNVHDLEEMLRYELKNNSCGEAVFGNHLPEKFLNNTEVEKLLENLFPEKPVVLFKAGHGTCVMNNAARNAFGFTPQKCNAEALHKIMSIYLNDRNFIDNEFIEYMKMLNSRGVTSVKEMGFDDYYGFTNVLKDFDNNDKLSVRISFMSQPVAEKTNISYGQKMRKVFQSEFVQFAGYNQMTDGLILGMEGHLMEPYEGTEIYCKKEIDYEQLEREVLEADYNDFRFTLHSEGDGAFHQILKIYDKCKKVNGKLKNRHGITDLELTKPEDEKKMAGLGVFGEIYTQIYKYDTYDNWVKDYENMIGHERRCRYLNYRSLIDNGVKLAAATDLPLLLPSVPEAIYYGCANYCKDKERQINIENTISIDQMLCAWTINAQYAVEREGILGTIEAGKRADLVIFDRNIFDTPMEKILETEVEMTIVNGKTVYKK